MSTPFPYVQPGDLLTADGWNTLIDELNSLEARVTDLETTSPVSTAPQITDRSPHGDFVNPGRLTLIGHNFVVPTSGNHVKLDGLDLSTFVTGSDDQNLIFDIPTLSGLPKHVSVTVQNSNGTSNAVDVFMKAPAIVVSGTMDIGKIVQNLPAIAIGTQTTFTFLVNTTTSAPVDLVFSPTYSSPSGSTINAWTAATAIVDPATGIPFPDSKVTIQSGHATPIGIQVIPPAGAVSVQLALHAAAANSSDTRLTQTSASIPIVIGSVYKDNASAPTFTVTGSAAVTKVTVGNLDIWQVPHGTTGALIKLTALYAAGGNYTFSAAIDNPGSTWAFNDVTQTVSPPTVTAAQKTKTQALTVSVNNLASAANADTALVTITAAKTNTDADGTPFSSTFSFLIGTK